MVKLTIDVLATSKSRQRRFKDESPEAYVKRLTHFGLMKRGITDLTSDVRHCRNAAAIYLYDNALQRLQFFDQCRFLTQLYLQRNKIRRISDLTSLHCLEKLYLGGNAITVVEGVHELVSLEELHVDNQDLPAGEKLVFDPRCFLGLSTSLRILNVSGNRLDDLSDIANLKTLVHLNASHNFIRSFRQLAKVLQSNAHLQRLTITGNPLSHTTRIRERILPLCPHLESLDSEPVNAVQRQFMINWEEARRRRRADKATRTSIQKPPPPTRNSTGRLKAPQPPRFPSKWSSTNPHWLPPLPKLRAKSKKVSAPGATQPITGLPMSTRQSRGRDS
eukprot:m.191485 g.191485  ORF g.191485 m.191485 type:complete len:333 (-) comp18357_c0_seq1:39-1037(-)